MELKVLWMYHDIMDLYGDRGNIAVLKYRCEKRGITFTLDTCDLGEAKDLDEYDLVFMGGGADKEQSILYNDLLERKDNILKAIDNQTFFLLICGGYQLFGQYYLDNNNHKIAGLGIFDYYTESNQNHGRCIGNIAIETILDGKNVKVVGFENHGGQTKNVDRPFGKVLSGHGNEYQGSYEGILTDEVLGTYIHGPLLPKNPELADYIITKALSKNNENVELESLNDEMEQSAKEVMLKRLNAL